MERPNTDADPERRGPRSPLLADHEASTSDQSLIPLLGARELEQSKNRHCFKAPTFILGLVFLEVAAFYGVYLNLIVYLQDVLHGDTASNAATVSSWAGVSYIMPVVGAAIADSYWGKYKTVLVGLCVSVVGMAVITASATLPSLRPPPCELTQSARCAPANLAQRLVFFGGIYLCGVGIGGAKAAVVSFGAEQFGDAGGEDAAERERKASYFSWYYAVSNLGMLTAGTLLVWVEDDVSWGLGYGVCASLVALAVVGLAATAPVYRIVPPAGSPLKGVFQVLVAFAHKVKLRVPEDAAELYEVERVKTRMPLLGPAAARERLEHTDQFMWLDKASVVTAADVEDGGGDPWRLCTVTQVEELKTLLQLVPIWLTSAVYFVANSQAQTTFVQQGAMTDSRIAPGVSVPAASLTSVETVLVVASVALYNRAVAPAARQLLGRAQPLTPLQLMGLGHAAVTAAVAVAACAEARRLETARARSAALSSPMGIAWLLPQYVVMAVSDASLTVGQLEFFYDQAPETMKGASTAFYFLSCSLGNLLSSQLVTVVASVTAAGGRTGWFPPDMDEGHLDYYFLLVVGITAVNFAVFVYLSMNYTPKRVR